MFREGWFPRVLTPLTWVLWVKPLHPFLLSSLGLRRKEPRLRGAETLLKRKGPKRMLSVPGKKTHLNPRERKGYSGNATITKVHSIRYDLGERRERRRGSLFFSPGYSWRGREREKLLFFILHPFFYLFLTFFDISNRMWIRNYYPGIIKSQPKMSQRTERVFQSLFSPKRWDLLVRPNGLTWQQKIPLRYVLRMIHPQGILKSSQT